MSDPRITLSRPDLAARGLEGLAPAAAYADPKAVVCAVPAAPLRRAPDPDAEQLDQLLFGERFEVLEEKDGFAWGQAARDGYVGYVEASLLTAPFEPATHRVAAVRTYAFAKPSIKSRALGPYSQGALVTVEGREGRFAKVEGSGWFIEAHLSPIGAFVEDPVAVAEQYLGAPYLWGGRESLGLDCSGLVQQALFAAGRACPRDTDQQEALGVGIERGDLRRGDLVFWKGHVGLMLDETRLLHANAFHMAVAIEPLQTTIDRYLAGGVGAPTGFRRVL